MEKIYENTTFIQRERAYIVVIKAQMHKPKTPLEIIHLLR